MTPQDAQSILDENFADWVRALDLTVTGFSPEGAVLRIRCRYQGSDASEPGAA